MTISLLPLERITRPNESKIDVIEIEEFLTFGNAFLEELVPDRRPREALVADGDPFREPMGHEEIGLVEIENMNDLMSQTRHQLNGLRIP